MVFKVPYLSDIPGAAELFAWFGQWPSFHDAEVLLLHLNRTGPSQLQVHTWQRTQEVDERGYYVTQKHVVVTFILEQISDLELNGFSVQNVLSALVIEKVDNAYKLDLGPCYGLNGTITARSLKIELEPRIPRDSIFHKVSR
jgi:hypothetical protein